MRFFICDFPPISIFQESHVYDAVSGGSLRLAGETGKSLPPLWKRRRPNAASGLREYVSDKKRRRPSRCGKARGVSGKKRRPSLSGKPAAVREKKSTGRFPMGNASAHLYPRHNEEAPLCTSSHPCNSPALTPRGCRLSYMTYLLRAYAPMAAVRHTVSPPLWSLPCVHSAVRRGSYPNSFKTAT